MQGVRFLREAFMGYGIRTPLRFLTFERLLCYQNPFPLGALSILPLQARSSGYL